jgi:hypothetical protein
LPGQRPAEVTLGEAAGRQFGGISLVEAILLFRPNNRPRLPRHHSMKYGYFRCIAGNMVQTYLRETRVVQLVYTLIENGVHFVSVSSRSGGAMGHQVPGLAAIDVLRQHRRMDWKRDSVRPTPRASKESLYRLTIRHQLEQRRLNDPVFGCFVRLA